MNCKKCGRFMRFIHFETQPNKSKAIYECVCGARRYKHYKNLFSRDAFVFIQWGGGEGNENQGDLG